MTFFQLLTKRVNESETRNNRSKYFCYLIGKNNNNDNNDNKEKSEIPALVMRRPNSRVILERSQPRPALSGQLTVTTVGSFWSLPCWITTTSSHGIPMTETDSGLVMYVREGRVQGRMGCRKSIAGARNGGSGE